VSLQYGGVLIFRRCAATSLFCPGLFHSRALCGNGPEEVPVWKEFRNARESKSKEKFSAMTRRSNDSHHGSDRHQGARGFAGPAAVAGFHLRRPERVTRTASGSALARPWLFDKSSRGAILDDERRFAPCVGRSWAFFGRCRMRGRRAVERERPGQRLWRRWRSKGYRGRNTNVLQHPWIGRTSGTGHSPHFDNKWRIEETVRALAAFFFPPLACSSCVPWFFMRNPVAPFFSVSRASTAGMGPTWARHASHR